MIAEIVLGASGLTSTAALIYFAVRYASEVRHSAAVEVAQAHAEGELSLLHFEIETKAAALAESQRRNRVIAEALRVEIDRNPNADLAADDVAGRLRRLEVAFSTDDDLSAVEHGDGVHPDPAAEATAAGDLPAEPATELR